MSDINKEEVFGYLKGFLKSKGIDIREGIYAEGIRKGCGILADTVNMSQRALVKARGEMDKGWDQVRQTVHERTAPRARGSAAPKQSASDANQTRTKSSGEKTASPKTKTTSSTRKKKSGK